MSIAAVEKKRGVTFIMKVYSTWCCVCIHELNEIHSLGPGPNPDADPDPDPDPDC